MNQPDNSSPESQKDTDCYCKLQPATRTLSAEQLRLWLKDRRNTAQEVRRGLLREAARLEKELATYDALLAELTIG
jgi:hypothetical protein